MFIPPERLKNNFEPSSPSKSKIYLRSSHLIIDKVIAASLFGDELNVHMVYYANRNALMIAKLSDELFKQIHKAKKHMLKGRTTQGDKSIALHDILIDHQLDNTDRDLVYEIEKGLGILNVNL